MDDPVFMEQGPTRVGDQKGVGAAGLIEDVLLSVFGHLSVVDLLSCRLVNKLWCRWSTSKLKSQTKPIRIIRDVHNINLMKFANSIRLRELDRMLPFGGYYIDVSQKISRAQPYLRTIFKNISPEKCTKLKVLFYYRPDTQAEAARAAESRNGIMTFEKLETLEFQIRFYEGFIPQFVNMEELLQRSKGMKRVNVTLTSFIGTEAQYPVVSGILSCLTNPNNNFRNVTTLGVDYSYLTAEHLRILTSWNHPIKDLSLGCFDLKPDPKYGFPGEALLELLSKRADTLQRLRIKVDKEYPWEDMVEEEVEMNIYVEDDEIRFPLALRVCHPIRFQFPKMKNLRSLEFLAANNIDICWAWRLDDNTFPETFPNLEKFSLIQFRYTKGDNPGFLPKLNPPSRTVREVTLPETKDVCDPILLYHMLSLFPNVASLEVHFNRMTLENIFTSVSNLEKLTIHLGEELVHLDSLFCGVPSMRHKTLTSEEAVSYNLEAERTSPSLKDLTKLQGLFITTEDDYVRISDVTALHVLLKMQHFRKLTVHSYPWEGCTSWLFSPSVQDKLEEGVELELKIFPMSRREKLFVW